MYTALKLLHVLSAIWLLSGLLARPTVLAAARRAPDMRILKAIADVSGRLEDRMIAPGIWNPTTSSVIARIVSPGVTSKAPATRLR